MAEAEKAHRSKTELESDPEYILRELQEKLLLARFPRRIEAFDISDIRGGFAVGSMVVFEGGEPLKSHYRHFRIKSPEPPTYLNSVCASCLAEKL